MAIDFFQRPRYNGTNLALATEAGQGLMNVVEVDLGSTPRRSGSFQLTTTGLTADQHVVIEQVNGPYTGKGTLADEAEMDQISVTGQAISSTVIQCYWTSPTLVKGSFKFAYTLVSTLNTVPSATDSTPGTALANMLSLRTAEVSVTGTTTLDATAFGKMHACSGTSADYTVTLPTVSGNAGKIIGFRGASALTKLVTLDGASAETVDGLASIILKANEGKLLLSTGTAWQVVADSGRTKPHLALDYLSNTTIANGTALSAAVWADLGPQHSFPIDSANSLVQVTVGGMAQIGNNVTACTIASRMVLDGAATYYLGGTIMPGGGFANPFDGSVPIPLTGLAAGSHTLQVQVFSALANSLYCRSGSDPKEILRVSVLEMG